MKVKGAASMMVLNSCWPSRNKILWKDMKDHFTAGAKSNNAAEFSLNRVKHNLGSDGDFLGRNAKYLEEEMHIPLIEI